MDNRDKIDRIFESADRTELLAWMKVHAYVDDKFALALLDKFWKPDSEDLKSIVEKCFMHSSYLRGSKYNWPIVEEELTALMPTIEKAVEEEDVVRAAYLAGYVMVLSCKAYQEDYYSRYEESRRPLFECVRRAEEIVRSILIEGETLDESSRIGILSEIAEGCEAFKDSPIFRVERFLEEAYLVTMPMKSYISFINKLLRRKRDFHHDFHVMNKAKCLLKNGRWDKTKEFLDKEIKNENVRIFYLELLVEHGEYRKALDLSDIDNNYSLRIEEWIARQMRILDLINDRNLTIDFCRRKIMTIYHRKEYYERLKETVPESEWPVFLNDLLRDCDFNCDVDDTEVHIYISEGMTNKVYPYIKGDGDYKIPENLKAYGKYLNEDQQKELARQYADWVIERSQDEDMLRRRDYRYIARWVESLAQTSPLCREEAILLWEKLEEIHQSRPAFMRELNSINI